MSNVQHVIGFKAWLLFFFPFFFRARQACNQMQFIYRNDTTSTDHDKVSSLVWDKAPFMVSLKGWIESMSLWEVAVRVGSFQFTTFGEKLVALIKKGKCRFWTVEAKRHVVKGLHYRANKEFYFYFMLVQEKENATLSPVNYVHMQLLHN